MTCDDADSALASDALIPSGDKWYLSFDCATKSFAWSLLCIRPLPSDIAQKIKALANAWQQKQYDDMKILAREVDSETKRCFQLVAGGAVDLVPGVADSKINTVRRVVALKQYMRDVIEPALLKAGGDGCPPSNSPELNVAVEFQMGANAPSRAVAVVLLSTYWEANVFMVGPAHKNKLWYPSRPEIRHCFYLERYSKTYDANKRHAKDLYCDHIAPIFGHDETDAFRGVPTKLRTDFSDSVIQVLGFRQYGDEKKAAGMF